MKKEASGKQLERLCFAIMDSVRTAKTAQDSRFMMKTVDTFRVNFDNFDKRTPPPNPLPEHLKNLKEGDDVENQKIPPQTFLEKAFVAEDQFQEQPCRTFLRDWILGQLADAAKDFADWAYNKHAKYLIDAEGVMDIFVEGNACNLEKIMNDYEREYGKQFEELLSKMQNAKTKDEKQEALASFQTETASRMEDFQDFRNLCRLLTKESYIKMYVGVVMIEAMPCLDAMMMPLIQKGAEKGTKLETAVKTAFETARDFYKKLPEEWPEFEPVPEPPETEHEVTWEYLKGKEWIPYESHHQSAINEAYEKSLKDGKADKYVMLEEEDETMGKIKIAWSDGLKYHYNEKTGDEPYVVRVCPNK